MIEVVAAKSGDRTISYKGKFLASRIDPRAEAVRWCEKYEAELKGLRSVIILGAGAGYHLSYLKKKFPHLNVICIEFSNEIIKSVKESIEISLLGIDFIDFTNTRDLFNEKLVQSALASGYRVLAHPSVRSHSSALANQLALDLNGRTELGFEQIIKIRKDFEEFEPSAPHSSRYYSLYDLVEHVEEGTYNVTQELLK